MKRLLIPTLAGLTTMASMVVLQAEEAPANAEAAPVKEEATDFLRVDQDDKAARLQTAVTRYEKNGVTVDLLGAVHIADQAYYDDLNKRFEAYDTLLFEMIGGEHLEGGKIPEPAEDQEKDGMMSALSNIYGTIAGFLKLADQKSAIDYSAKNFIHADLTLAEFTKLQAERGESILSFALAAGNQAAKNGGPKAKQPNLSRLVTAVLVGNSNAVKMELIHSLGQGDDQIAAFAGDSVIISDRNAKCLEVLAGQIGAGKKNCGIFYGAAHYPDMEERLIEDGFKKTGHEWITAWDIPKPKPKAKPPVDQAKPEKEAA